ncbi:PAS domain S-box protein [Pannus brasiliensis CCIBt3594]|uniref:histidine kinase n=1 Tax=Pannus brasiliensis CCIBt3594 TaxID=1427578 RepID=A0AAW9QNY3_9CHRO
MQASDQNFLNNHHYCPCYAEDAGTISAGEAIDLFNLAGSLLSVVGLDGYFKRINPAFEKVLGYDRATLLNTPFMDFVHPDDRAKTGAEMEKLQTGQPTLYFENRYRCPDGIYKWLAWTVTPIVRSRLMYAVAQDISDRKALETSARQHQERLQFALQGSNDGIWDWNLLTDQVYFSPRWKSMLGFAEDEIGDNLEEWSARVHPDDLERVLTTVRDHLAGETPFYVSEHRARCKDGTYKWILDRGRVLYDATGRAIRMVGTHTDISDRKELEQQLKTARAELERRVQERTEQLQETNAILAERETLYRTLARHIPNGSVVLFDRDLRYFLCEGEELKPCGLDPEEMVGKSLAEVFPEEVCRTLEPQYRDALDGLPSEREIFYRGQMYETRAVPVRDERGEIFAGMVLTQNITGRKMIELELQESERRTRSILDRSEAVIYLKDLQGRYLFVNRQYEKLCGITNEEIPGRTDYDIFPATVADRFVENDREVIAKGTACRFEEIIPLPEGARTYLAIKFLLTDNNGRPYAICGISTDITERKQAEEILRGNEQRLREIIERMPVLINALDERGNFVMWNDECERVTGYTRDEVIGRSELFDKLYPDPEYLREKLHEWRDRGDNYRDWEWKIVCKDGATKTIAWSNISADYPIAGWASWGIGVDVTERERTAAILRRSEEKYRELSEAIEQFIWISGPDGSIDYCNRYFYTYTGLTPERILGGTAIETVHPAERDRVIEGWNRARDRREPYEFEYRCRRGSDGTYRWFLGRVNPTFDDGGRIVRWLGRAIDVDDRKRAEMRLQKQTLELERLNTALQNAAEELTRRNQELDRFAYVVSHDLKAPLRAIANLSEWIEEDLTGELSADTRRNLDLLRGRVYRLDAMIDGLLAYSRVGRIKTRPETVDIRRLITEVLDSLDPPAAFTLDTRVDVPPLQARRLLLFQVLSNLIDNAIKHHHRSDGHIEVVAIDTGEEYEFSVRDDGPGISPEFHEKIFEIFQVLKPRDKSESTGIGLSLVKKIIDTEGGHLSIDSREGEGTTFTFTWPKAPLFPDTDAR